MSEKSPYEVRVFRRGDPTLVADLIYELPPAKEFIVIGIQEDLGHVMQTSMKLTSLPFFLLRVLHRALWPEET